jgi:hypothetical protein
MESFAKDIIVGWQLQSPIDNKLVIIGGNNKQMQEDCHEYQKLLLSK